MPVLLQQAVGQPGGGDKRDHQREQHCQRGADGHRAHVGAHQAGDKDHRQHRGDHGKGGQNGGIAYFANRGQGGLHFGKPPHGKVAMQVFGDDDGIIHHNPGNENKRKEGHPVEGVVEQVIDKQGQRKGDRHRGKHHQSSPPPQE